MALIVDDLIENLPNINSASDNHLRLAKIAQEVCAKHGIIALDRKRTDAISAARYEYFYRALAETTDSPNKIARIVDCDHTTVMYGASRYALHNDIPMPRKLSHCCKALQSEGRNYPKPRATKNYHRPKDSMTIYKYLNYYDPEKEQVTLRERAKKGSAALLERLREVHGQPRS